MPPPDTIVAIATAAGRGAVGIVRLSGPDTFRIGTAIVGAMPAPRRSVRRRFRDADGQTLDEGLACYFPAPASFTGEHVLELQGHGGGFVLDRVLKRVLELGARMARPGEFTERAFLNGRMDLAQAEAVADLIDAGTVAAARAAVRSLQGEFSARIRELQSQLTGLRIHVEAAIDFPDDDLDLAHSDALRDRLTRLEAGFDQITAAARQGALLREGLSVVIAGKPNAGKSSLLNRLAGDDVAIVTPLPGTTRDLLRQQVQVDGLPVNLVDTAGLRTAADAVEEEGIRRARVQMQRADRVLYVSDAAEGLAPPGSEASGEPPPDDEGLSAAVPVTWVVNKIDLSGREPGEDVHRGAPRLFVSAKSGAGIDLLRRHLKTVAGFAEVDSGAFSARRRHLDALARARSLMQGAAAALRRAESVELCAEDLRLAQLALSEITGEFGSDDLLGEIFGSFCIGK
jgi:tRNA modification GTPase